jgi:hypothetical protein
MHIPLPIHVELTEFEQALFEQISFGDEAGSRLVSQASGKASRQLMESLIKRDAIPAARWAYFTDPFPGGRGKSHLEVFKANLEGRNLFEDPTFVDLYLRYFIFGPELPPDTMVRFCSIAAEEDIEHLRSFVRQETRNARRANRRKTADEFYKLALECFPHGSMQPRWIRDTAMQGR